MNIQRV